MELGQYQIQVFISLVVILCAACITVICEFVKNRQQSTEQANQATTVNRTATDTHAASKPKAKRPKEKRTMTAEAAKAVERGTQLAQTFGGAPVIQVELAAVRALREPAEVRSAVEVAFARAEPLVLALEIPTPAPVQPEPVVEAVVDTLVFAPEAEPAVVAASVVEKAEAVAIHNEEVAAPSEPEPAAPPKRNWGSVLQSSKQNQSPRPAPSSRLSIPIKPSTLPSGFQDGFLLTKLVQNRQPVSGLVVSVGLEPQNDAGIPESIDTLIRSLLGPADFAARASEDQYLLIFPSERGEAAERRLSQITEHLANANYAILFSCGGVEVRSQAIQQAIASASERMQEIRSQRGVTVGDSLSQAV